ncbi:hypothetical protein [Sorangium sp. So ce854]|uniref:hypothetical protein n=1 Tax=Sorangium sp. So ce854 TaxID=3133322 RepID=UPI003F5DDE14
MGLIGERTKLAVDIGDPWEGSKQNQHIKVWLGGKDITSVDDVVYLPTFYSNLKNDIEKLKSYAYVSTDDAPSNEALFARFEEIDAVQHRILSLDSTTMSARCYYVYSPDSSYILFSYWDERHEPKSEVGKVFRVDIGREEIINTLQASLQNISAKWH